MVEATVNGEVVLEQARAQIRAEARVVDAVAEQLDESFVRAVQMVAECTGRIFVTGAGTSGAIAYRLAHLLGTCGVPAFFIPPGDALHGESAIAAPGDILIALSKAGKSSDINQYARIAGGRGCAVMAWTANPDSELATLSDLTIVLATDEAGEGEGLLPFGSTLAHGVLGDALCLMVKQLRGFDLKQLRQTHPLGGAAELVAKSMASPEGDGR